MRLVHYCFIVLVALTALPALGAEKAYDKFLGSWDFSAPNAPQPYDHGKVIFTAADQKLAGELQLEEGKLAIAKLTCQDNELTLILDVDNTTVTVRLHLKEGNLEGAADSSDGPIRVTAKPTSK